MVTHFGGASSRQTCPERRPQVGSRRVAEELYLQLFRSRFQFYSKFGDERRVNRFETHLRLAYGPRAIVARPVSIFDPSWTSRARTYRRLLAELPGDVSLER
ncbi:MAG: hypothetical protein GY759_11215 [Chloroflexi bacterium]|nr:hypothetical protein [Chloroflexota bacterium]